MSRPPVRELVQSLAFYLVLVGIAEVLVRAADWSRLTALLVVLGSGYALKALVVWLLARRSGAETATTRQSAADVRTR